MQIKNFMLLFVLPVKRHRQRHHTFDLRSITFERIHQFHSKLIKE